MIGTNYNEEHALATWKSKETVKQRNETSNNDNNLTSFELCVYLYSTGSNKKNTGNLQSTMHCIQKIRNKRTFQNLSDIQKALNVGMVYAKQIKY